MGDLVVTTPSLSVDSSAGPIPSVLLPIDAT